MKLLIMPTRRSFIQGIRSGPRFLVIFRNKPISYDEELLASCSTPKLEDHPLSAARDCLFNIFGAVSSIRNLRTRHAVVTRDPPNMRQTDTAKRIGQFF
jgi:hypothetical protein